MFEYLNRSLNFKEAIKDAMAQLDSKAAQQMLLHHYKAVLEPKLSINITDVEVIAGSPNYRERFVQEMDNMGFPQNPCIRNVAIINGSDVGNLQRPEPNNSNPTGGGEAMSFNMTNFANAFIRSVFNLGIGSHFELNMYNSPAYNQRSSVFKSNYKRGLFFSPSIENRFVKGNGISNSLDIVPGGYFRVNDLVKEVDTGLTGNFINVDVKFSEQSFIPSVSSMALYQTGRNWGTSLHSIVLNPTATETPFKAIVAPAENQIHVLITPQNVQFIRDQILYRNQNIPVGCTN